jgi:hypothetical protein
MGKRKMKKRNRRKSKMRSRIPGASYSYSRRSRR